MWIVVTMMRHSNTSPLDDHFADDLFKCIFLNKNIWILIANALKFVLRVQLTFPILVQIMAWRRPGDKPLSEPCDYQRVYASLGLNELTWINAHVWVDPRITWDHHGKIDLCPACSMAQGPPHYSHSSCQTKPWKHFAVAIRHYERCRDTGICICICVILLWNKIQSSREYPLVSGNLYIRESRVRLFSEQ